MHCPEVVGVSSRIMAWFIYYEIGLWWHTYLWFRPNFAMEPIVTSKESLLLNPFTTLAISKLLCIHSLYCIIWSFIRFFPSSFVWVSRNATFRDNRLSLSTKTSPQNAHSHCIIWNYGMYESPVKIPVGLVKSRNTGWNAESTSFCMFWYVFWYIFFAFFQCRI